MNILSVAYPLFPVSPDSAGGAEQILGLLDRGLEGGGHKSIVVAAAGSRVNGALVQTPAAGGEITDAVRNEAQQAHLDCIEHALEQFRVDLVHFHGLDFRAYVPAAHVPKLTTLHLPLAWYSQSIFNISGVRFCCVSESQARTAPAGLNLPVISNGIEVRRYRANMPRGNFLLWLGRICPEKGTDIALRIAHRLDLPLVVAGPVHPFADHQAYFRERVEPMLDEKRRYLHSIGMEQKVQLLAQARCVLIPSLAAETGSLVAMEAIASGTRVIAFRSGALPEIIEHEVTGFIVDSEDEMAKAISRAGEISPELCRKEALRRFDAGRMIKDYIGLYREILASG